jgi:transcriptional regulator with XRE-family HTH domain
MLRHIAKVAQEKRLSLNLSQQSLADRSGVSLGTLKKFERTGQISLESLLKIALPLECLNEFMGLFKPNELNALPALDILIKDNTRKRGRK